MYTKSYFCLTVVLALSISSCATITRGSTDTLVINSTPSGPQVSVSKGLSGTTPATFKLDRDFDGVVKISKEGFETIEVIVTHQTVGAGGAGMAGNVLFGGIIGVAVDAGSGAMYDLVPNPIEAVLVPVAKTEVDPIVDGVESSIEDKLKKISQLLESELITQEEYETMRKRIIETIQ